MQIPTTLFLWYTHLYNVFVQQEWCVLCLDSPVIVCNIDESNDNKCALRRIGDHVPTLNQPSLETFLRDFLKPQLPLKITGRV